MIPARVEITKTQLMEALGDYFTRAMFEEEVDVTDVELKSESYLSLDNGVVVSVRSLDQKGE